MPNNPPATSRAEDLRRHGVSAATFADLYREKPAWETGRPQPEIIRMADGGAFRGEILDVGCGTGENALYLAVRGLNVTAVDFTPAAIEQAVAKSRERKLPVDFRVHDALRLPELKLQFDTVLDSALFHTFSDDQRPVYVAGLAAVTRPGGTLYLISFGEAETREGGPRRVTQAELRASFADGWAIETIRPIRYEANIFPDGARCWLAQVRRA